MASQASISSSQPDQRQLRLIAASAQGNESRVCDILAEEPPWTSSTDQDALRQSLQKVSARAKLSLARILLQNGAEANARKDNEIPALVKAAEGGHIAVVEELLAHGASLDWRSRGGQTALFSASLKGKDNVVRLFLQKGAGVNDRDKEGRTPLLFMASEKRTKWKWTINTLRLLLEHGACTEAKDQLGRTPLLWCATNNHQELAEVLLQSHANVASTNNRGRSALHLAAENDHKELATILLRFGADPCATSDGGWQALHNAAQNGHSEMVSVLLDAGADVNAQLSNGMTPLHWSAFNGSEDTVNLILSWPEVNLAIRDSFDRTPMLAAAEQGHASIVQLLSPARAADRLSPAAVAACRAFEATIVDFGQFEKRQLVSKYSVYDLLYGWDADNDKPKVATAAKNIKYLPQFRWIHLPACNIAWVETLLAKAFIETGHRDIEAYKALEKCFSQEHRGNFAHAHFMRTFCQRISATRPEGSEKPDERSLDSLSEEPSDLSSKSSQQAVAEVTSRKVQDHSDGSTPKYDAKKKSKSEQIAERHPKRHKRARGPPGNPPQRQDSIVSGTSSRSSPVTWHTTKSSTPDGKIVLFMPFLHYETDERRKKMSSAIQDIRERRRLPANPSRDALLLEAYLNNTPPVHPRRTLDQSFYHGIDTSSRDTDQVVYRYCKRHQREAKVFMVDQLWLWVIGKELIITCFPQRWDQPKRDPLNVLDGIIEETNAKTRPPIQSVYDLAMLIISRCAGPFDRHRPDDQDYQFLDMFEASIGLVTHRESELFGNFYDASARSAKLLKVERLRRSGRAASLASIRSSRGNGIDQLTDALLDIGVETSLLTEIKDIRDELNIIASILDSQLSALSDFENHRLEEIRDEGSRKSTEGMVNEVRRQCREVRRRLESSAKDMYRMDRQAESLYMSLTDLLDLKQKHSNALEARFAGEQAVIAAKQGQTIMAFTIVTILFLPLSFISSFFAINFEDWGGTLTIDYVSKYLFGIGLGISVPLIFMAFFINDIFDGVHGSLIAVQHLFAKREEPIRKDDEHPHEDAAWYKRAEVTSRKGRPSFHKDDQHWLAKGQMAGGPLGTTATQEKGEGLRLDSHLSPTSVTSSQHRRKHSASSAIAIAWARPSHEKSRYRESADLEAGKSSQPRGRS